MDHDLLLDLRHLDDPSPPSFGALRAEDAAHRAARERSRRARMLAGAVIAVALVTGTGVLVRPGGRTAQHLQTATPPTTVAEPTTLPSPTAPEIVATTLAPPPGASTTAPAPTAAPTTPPTTAAAGPGGANPAETTTSRPAAGAPLPTQLPIARPGPPPAGTGPAPAGLSFTLAMGAGQVRPGGTLPGVVTFRNTRSTPVTLASGCTFWPVNLYRAGRIADGNEVDCTLYQTKVVAPGQEVSDEVSLRVEASVAPGTYDLYAVIGVETDGVKIHSPWRTLDVVGP